MFSSRILGIASYLFAFTWGICILFALMGWGGILNQVLFPKQRVDWGQRAAWGVAFSVVVGGVLNVTWTISRATVLIYLGMGFLYCLVDAYRNRQSSIKTLSRWFSYRKDRLFTIGVILFIFLILLQYAGWVYSHLFHPGDDYGAYFVFPHKMLQTGSLGADPFSGRRLQSSLGGQYFLFTFPLSILNETNYKLIDPGVSLIIIVGLLASYLKKKQIRKEIAILLIILFLLIPHPQVQTLTNITTGLISIALFLSLFLILDREKLENNYFLSNACIIALTTAAICSLKSNLIPACGIFFISSYICYILTSKNNSRRIAIYEFLISSILVLVFILPWMISMYQSSGTLLYPILGKGYYISSHTDINILYDKLSIDKIIDILIKTTTTPAFFALISLSIINFFLRRHHRTNIPSHKALLS